MQVKSGATEFCLENWNDLRRQMTAKEERRVNGHEASAKFMSRSRDPEFNENRHRANYYKLQIALEPMMKRLTSSATFPVFLRNIHSYQWRPKKISSQLCVPNEPRQHAACSPRIPISRNKLRYKMHGTSTLEYLKHANCPGSSNQSILYYQDQPTA